MRYCPVASVTAARDFSINDGLVASTVTPGSTPPEVSLTTPASAAWANADAGTSVRHANNKTARFSIGEPRSFCWWNHTGLIYQTCGFDLEMARKFNNSLTIWSV